MFREIIQVRWKSEVDLPWCDIPPAVRVIFRNRALVDIASLPKREATVEERRKMMGSVGTAYEMKLPIAYCEKYGKFFLVDYFEKAALIFEEEVDLVLLKTDRVLPSVFRKVHRKPKQIWR